jgi:hypothetical protein
MWKWLEGLMPKEPTVSIEAHPASVNPTPGERQQRNIARMARLRQMIADGDTRQSVKDELERRERVGR